MIRIQTLGGLSVRDDAGQPLSGAAAQARRMALLALLARAGERGLTREKILSLLWPEADEDRGSRALSQAIYALRQDLGAEEAIAGSRELRLDVSSVSSDVANFSAALARGDDERAAALYGGPFLDGFHLPGAVAFERWAEGERGALAMDYARVLESLARAARSRGDAPTAVGWWHKLAALEPLNARVTVGLMESLAASGDRAGAIRQARIYELLVEQELDLPPDREVTQLAERLRRGDESMPTPVAPPPAPPPAIAPDARPPAIAPDAAPAAIVPNTLTSALHEEASIATVAAPVMPEHRSRPDSGLRPKGAMLRVLWTAPLILIGIIALRWLGTSEPTSAAATGSPIIAIGRVVSFGGDSASAGLASPVADLLTTSLARVKGIRVVSHGRMLELMRDASTVSDTGAGRFADAARRGGATAMVDGTLYARPDGRLRLDLRRVDLANGSIGGVTTVEGSDLFALVDSGTARLVSELGGSQPAGSVADVTTKSLAAFRVYEQGIRAFYRGERAVALDLFDAALAEDSLFALAAYYGAMAAPDPAAFATRIDRAKRLSTRASDRERLKIMAGWARNVSSPLFTLYADSLVTRFPNDVEGFLYVGIARVLDGEFLAALDPLERVVVTDSLAGGGGSSACNMCEALSWRTSAYLLADSMPAAEREARRWQRLKPAATDPSNALVDVLDAEGRYSEALALFQTASAGGGGGAMSNVLLYEPAHLIRAGDFAGADRLLAPLLQSTDRQTRSNASWASALSLRSQGRLREALAAARQANGLEASPKRRLPGTTVLEAQLELEMGQPVAAAHLFQALADQPEEGQVASQLARRRAWILTHAANAFAAAGDSATVARLADSVRVYGEQSAFGRDRRLHHHVQGLLLTARGDTAGAIAAFRRALYSTTLGYTRTNYELSGALLRAKQPAEAVSLLQAALRGGVEASNLYVNRIELHERLAEAWEAVGGRDSAAAHYATVEKAWAGGDAAWRARSVAAGRRAAALARRGGG